MNQIDFTKFEDGSLFIDTLKLKTYRLEKLTDNQKTVPTLQPLYLKCGDCELIVNPKQIQCDCGQSGCHDYEYRCSNCDSLNLDWLIHSLNYAHVIHRDIVRLSLEVEKSLAAKIKENLGLLEALGRYWQTSNIIDPIDVCSCGHLKEDHDKKSGCNYQFKQGQTTEYQDNLGYCVCTEFVKEGSQ